MISLDTAKKLKEAGLEWKEQQQGDCFYNPYMGELGMIYGYMGVGSDFIYAPRLDQLLEQIEKRGYTWMINEDSRNYVMVVVNTNIHKSNHLYADSPEEAAAQALLWILEKEANA